MTDALLGGRYEIVGQLGAGGVATVYDALDVTIGRPVAIKVLQSEHRKLEDVRKRLLREGYLGALLVHPHVCTVSDIGTLPDGSPFLVLTRLAGKTVAEKLHAAGRLPVETATRLGEHILSALSAAHARGIVHRDIKPANVLMATVNGLPPSAVLLDFGTAVCPRDLLPPRLATGDAPIESQLTAAGMVIGTPHYLAPEQASGHRDIDGRTDLYQVGVFLYEALSNEKPVSGASFAELIGNISRGNLRPLAAIAPSLPKPLLSVVERALATRREHRFQSAEEMLEALQATREAVTASSSLQETVTAPMLPRDRIR